MTSNAKSASKKLAVVQHPASQDQPVSRQQALQRMPAAELIQQELAGAKSVEGFFGREGIFARLFASTIEGLLEAELVDQRAFTQNPDALKKIGDNADAVILGAATVLHPAIFFTLGAPDGRDKQYDPVPPLKGPSGVQYTGYNFPSEPGATFVLTNKASKEAQVAALKMLDYIFTTEGEIRGMFGTDERTVVKPGSSDIALEQGVTPLYKQIPIPAGASPYNNAWGSKTQYNNTKEFGSVSFRFS